MLNIKIPENNNNYNSFEKCVLSSRSFTVTGLTAVLRLLLIKQIKKITQKKILFITSTEQNALRYKNDLSKAFDENSEILPFQNISMYENVFQNKYDYANQYKILTGNPDIVIAPVKVFLEKFPKKEFYTDNEIELKIGDEIDTKGLAQNLINLGYKRSTMVNDIGEFSIRGDIIDFYTLDENPVRIELWGDEIVDLRYFDNETQRSIEKIKSVKILPMYKFMLPKGNDIKPKKLREAVELEGYFEGIEIYQNSFNKDLVSPLYYFKDYVIIFDETSEIYSKYEFTDKNFEEQYLENLKLELNFEIEGRNHISFEDFLNSTAGFVKIGFNNFIDGDFGDIVEFNSLPVQNFGVNLDSVADYIKEYQKSDYDIIISTDYPDRVKEILSEHDIFDTEYSQSISSAGSVLEEFKTVVITDRELFNKRSKEITASKRSYYKEKPEYIENINDIKEGEYVVHSIHGVGIYTGISKQELDGELKDYLTIEYASKDKLHIPAEQINLLVRYRGSGTVKPKLSRMGGKDWENTKTKVKKEVEQVAYDLLRLYAKRKMQKGIQFLPDTNWQVEWKRHLNIPKLPIK
ncbi:hypothetical protein II810_03525 [bacterium]|nr:hypothetical protein [bacterium]